MTEPLSPPLTPLSPPTVRRLVRSREDRVLGGVCGGLGRYLDVDPVVVRIITAALILSGVGVLAYIIAWIVIPEAPPDQPELVAPPPDRRTTMVVIGGAMIAIGGLLVVRQTMPWFEHAAFWPLIVVAAGVAVLITARR
jgi:phage shock protein C